jgi:membrane-associated phospholipid phosphatase
MMTRPLALGVIPAIAAALVACSTMPVRAQSNVHAPPSETSSAAPTPAEGNLSVAPDLTGAISQPAGPAPTPRHTGLKAMAVGFVIDFKYLPSRENALWAGAGGGLALAVHPVDDDVNVALVGSDAADKFFKAGAVLGELPTLLGSAAVVYAVGRFTDEPKVSHVGMDLIQSLAMAEVLTQTLKYITRRERPDHSDRNSFPSGHAADTFAFATALERHLGWRYAVPAYTFASYVAISRLPADRHWLSDAVFGSAVGIIAGRTVTGHEATPFPVAVTFLPGGVAIVYSHRGRE